MLDMSLMLAKRLNCTNQRIIKPLDDVPYILNCMKTLPAHSILVRSLKPYIVMLMFFYTELLFREKQIK